jgi:hypothetical protein
LADRNIAKNSDPSEILAQTFDAKMNYFATIDEKI